jgi:hypothetical protein
MRWRRRTFDARPRSSESPESFSISYTIAKKSFKEGGLERRAAGFYYTTTTMTTKKKKKKKKKLAIYYMTRSSLPTHIYIVHGHCCGLPLILNFI